MAALIKSVQAKIAVSRAILGGGPTGFIDIKERGPGPAGDGGTVI